MTSALLKLFLYTLLEVGFESGARIGGSPIGRSVRLSPNLTLLCLLLLLPVTAVVRAASAPVGVAAVVVVVAYVVCY